MKLIAGIAVHLATAGLPLGKADLMSEVLEYAHKGSAGAGKKRVVEAGYEECDSQYRSLVDNG